MSNVYEVEPPTTGKVLVHTTYGPLEMELWCRECPLHTRTFLQLCLEGALDRIPLSRAMGGLLECSPFPSLAPEYHTRLKWNRRGLVGVMDGPMFVTLETLPELYRTATVFGKVVGETIYNLVRMEELERDPEGVFAHPPLVTRTEVLVNPFDDIIPREFAKPQTEESRKIASKPSVVAVKNKKVLSFHTEEEESAFTPVSVSNRIRSSHEVLDDPTLAKTTVSIDSTKVKKEAHKGPTVTSNALRELEQMRSEGVKEIQSKIAQVQQDLKSMHHHVPKQTELPASATRSDSLAQLLGVRKQPSSTVLEEQRAAYKSRKRVIMGKRRAGDEMDTLLALNTFRSKLSAHPTQNTHNNRDVTTLPEVAPAATLEICKLHGLVGCESCRDTFGGRTEEGTEEGWLMHRLVFDKEAGYRQIRGDLDQLSVIDPRDRVKPKESM
jgi:peptidyl-prolyl cis-trans isomerase SDCCAG10